MQRLPVLSVDFLPEPAFKTAWIAVMSGRDLEDLGRKMHRYIGPSLAGQRGFRDWRVPVLEAFYMTMTTVKPSEAKKWVAQRGGDDAILCSIMDALDTMAIPLVRRDKRPRTFYDYKPL